MDRFEGKVAVITGAASGFGREFALKGAAFGMKLVLADIDATALDATVTSLRERGAEARGVRTDVSNPADVDALARATLDAFGGAHLLFNNAGVGAGGFIWESSANDWQWVFGVNVMGVANGIRAFTPIMLAQNEPAHIVNTASVAGLLAAPAMGVYNASKHAVVAMTETLYHDLRLARASVGVSLLCPAFVPTGIADAERARPGALVNDEEMTASQKLAARQLAKAVEHGKLSARDVAELTFDAIRANRFYVVTHPNIMPSVQLRLDDIAQLRDPSDPMSLKSR
ncbi:MULTISPECIES: SDR family oxidoreductase [unclassified Caballeronia]|uniref:SDR family oxidoreductase n=1 Tax=unclassified Caballeronia TaxID=2646786 RepID=UPI0028665E1A|nr:MULTISPECIES: SDR family oxidoreductase [unclassified Caballeronia]MDR5771449.1 SDR family oxidoreductase [Caballeronia sp. LZ002]MDR5846885.1 SDR family oxidoreductase [Caballeronia sp. LZ003]